MGEIMEYPELGETVWANTQIKGNPARIKGKVTGILEIQCINSKVVKYVISVGSNYCKCAQL